MPLLVAPRTGNIQVAPVHFLPFANLFTSNTTRSHTPRSPPSDVNTISDTLSSGASSPVEAATLLQPLVPDHDFHDNDDDAPLVSHTISTLTTTSNDSPIADTCVVCMDNDKNIALAPCKHSHCCFACFRRSEMRSCPVCRTPVSSIIILSTGMQLPVLLIAPKSLRDRTVQTRSSGNLRDPLLYDTPHHLYSRQSTPSLMSGLDDATFLMRSRTSSMSSGNANIARQAQSSVRSLSREQDVAFRQLRETGSVHPHDFAPARAHTPLQRRYTIASTTSPDTTVSEAHSEAVTITPIRDVASGPRRNMVLIGHDRKTLKSLAQRLLATFPPVDDHEIAARSKSTMYINGEAVQLVLIECPMFSMGPELVVRVQRQYPKLVLLCADYFNVSSFESVVRLDMEMLDYLNITCVWVLVKSTQRPKESNIVDEADVRIAKHFLGKPRRCFTAPVDGAFQSVAMRKLGWYIYRSVTRNASSRRLPPTLEDKQARRSSRSLSLFCLQPEKCSRRKQRDACKLTMNLARWLS